MRPILLKVTPAANASIDIRHEVAPYFCNPWHFHPEYELTLILKSAGVRFVGDNIERFAEGELTLVGPNLPHYWRNDPSFYQRRAPAGAEAIILRFSESCLGEDFFTRPEMHDIRHLLHKANRGVKIEGAGRDAVTARLKATLHLNGFRRMLEFLALLYEAATNSKHRLLASRGFSLAPDPAESERVNRVFAYLIENFTRPVHLKEVAAVAHMNDTAFCRYFRQHTGKTLIGLINEMRIGYACKLLAERELNISEICYACGFQNLSNFNRLFKTFTRLTPTEYRRRHLPEN